MSGDNLPSHYFHIRSYLNGNDPTTILHACIKRLVILGESFDLEWDMEIWKANQLTRSYGRNIIYSNRCDPIIFWAHEPQILGYLGYERVKGPVVWFLWKKRRFSWLGSKKLSLPFKRTFCHFPKGKYLGLPLPPFFCVLQELYSKLFPRKSWAGGLGPKCIIFSFLNQHQKHQETKRIQISNTS